MKTPWGKAYDVAPIADGIVFCTTVSHGGYKLTRDRNAQIPKQWRYPGGWYEEDCGWAPLAIIWPELFPEDARELAPKIVVKYWEPWVASRQKDA